MTFIKTGVFFGGGGVPHWILFFLKTKQAMKPVFFSSGIFSPASFNFDVPVIIIIIEKNGNSVKLVNILHVS